MKPGFEVRRLEHLPARIQQKALDLIRHAPPEQFLVSGHTADDVIESYWSWLDAPAHEKHGRTACFVALAPNNQPVGIAMLGPLSDFTSCLSEADRRRLHAKLMFRGRDVHHVAQMHSLVVHPDFRDQGVDAALDRARVEHVEQSDSGFRHAAFFVLPSDQVRVRQLKALKARKLDPVSIGFPPVPWHVYMLSASRQRI
ncbi:GNAT family N-acetyltransferase [Candidatus Micrarchaeota archaeon]|nr:GNAT family N-acetyltransferase [Candidatus Micrarchaeota archaeon]